MAFAFCFARDVIWTRSPDGDGITKGPASEYTETRYRKYATNGNYGLMKEVLVTTVAPDVQESVQRRFQSNG